MARLDVAGDDELAEGCSVKFRFVTEDGEQEGFLIRYRGRLHAYRNRCRHIPMTMDWVENRFLSRDRCYIQCSTHGALYEIDTGRCVAGPPTGKFLHALDLEVVDGRVMVTVPE